MIKKYISRLRTGKPAHEEPVAPKKAAEQPAAVEKPTPQKLPNAPLPLMQFAKEMPVLAANAVSGQFKLSFILIVYKMPDQAEKTLHSLSAAYQQGVTEQDYEVIVVENESSDVLGEERACQYGNNVRYFLRQETLSTPVPAINFGASEASGSHICIMIDGARMVTPGVVSYMRAAASLCESPVISVPGYHLGPKVQQQSMLEGYDRAEEKRLLDSVQWPEDGYRLFEIGCLSGSSAAGFFKPVGESNCICVTRELYQQAGGFDEQFTETGGGQVNLDFYKRCAELEETTLVTLLGEGSFHQFHGGITTGTKGDERKQAMIDHFAQYAALRGGPYCPPAKRSIYLGAIPDNALRFIRHGANTVIKSNKLAESVKKPE